MTPIRTRLLALAALAGAALGACSEQLTAPADCPALCPGGQGAPLDTVLTPVVGRDSSYQGYVLPGRGTTLLVSDSLRAGDYRAVIRFFPLADTIIIIRDSIALTYTVDSIALQLSLVARDTAVQGLSVFFYRLPGGVDSTFGFQQIEDSLNPGNLIDSVAVPDSVASGSVRLVLPGAALGRAALVPADSGVLAVGIRIRAGSHTGIRIGSVQAGAGSPVFLTYASADTTDTTLQKHTLTRFPAFNTFLQRSPPAFNPDLLTLGGDTASRAILRWELPPAIRDSGIILRATLELTPADTIFGLPGDSGTVQIRNLLADLGAKSPLASLLTGIPGQRVGSGRDTTLTFEIAGLVRTWKGSHPLPSAIAVSLAPEGATFLRAELGSTRAGVIPRLRITYELPYPFERP